MDPISGESFSLYPPEMEGKCFEKSLEELTMSYCGYHLLLVLGNAPSHTSWQICHLNNVSLLALPAYSPELNPVERRFEEFRRALSNKTFQTTEMLQEGLKCLREPFWKDPSLLRRLTGLLLIGGSHRRGSQHLMRQRT